jgi:hypothetical protein
VLLLLLRSPANFCDWQTLAQARKDAGIVPGFLRKHKA